MMTEEPPLLGCTVEADVSLAVVWTYPTDLATWDDPAAAFSLDGPVVPGSRERRGWSFGQHDRMRAWRTT